MIRLSNNENLIEQAVVTYSDMVLRLAYQRISNISAADDIVQEAFIKLLHKDRFNDEYHMKAWLIRVTINLCKDFNKSAWQRKRSDASPENTLAGTYTISENITDELNQLQPDDRDLVYLYYYEGYTVREISLTLNINENTVSSRLSRARTKLRKIIEDSNDE